MWTTHTSIFLVLINFLLTTNNSSTSYNCCLADFKWDLPKAYTDTYFTSGRNTGWEAGEGGIFSSGL